MCYNTTPNLNIYKILMFWTTQIISEVSAKKDVFCHCKYKILETKWYHWLSWYYKNTYYIYKNNKINLKELQSISNTEYIDTACLDTTLNIDITKTINNANNQWQKYIKQNETIFSPIVDLFTEIHQVLLDEFITEMSETRNISYEEYVNNIGKILYEMCKNSIFELAELNIPCIWLADETHKIPTACNINTVNTSYDNTSLKIFVNNVYNVNNFAVKKLKKLHDKFISVPTTKTPIKIIFNFKYYTEWNLKKMTDMICAAHTYFGIVEIINVDTQEHTDILLNLIKNNSKLS